MSGAVGAFQGVNRATADDETRLAFLLSDAGLTWEHAQEVVRRQLGAGNLAALEAAASWFDDVDTTQPTAVLQFVRELGGNWAGWPRPTCSPGSRRPPWSTG